MKFKCKRCGTEFKAKFDVQCPKCGSVDVDTIYEYNIHPQPQEATQTQQ